MTRQDVRRAVSIAASLVSAAFLARTYTRYRADIAQARARAASRSAVVATPCGPIEYAEAGEGPPLLVVHGAGGGYDQGLDFAEPLASRGIRVIATSRFGYLRTPLPADASPAAQADAHACLLDALGIDRAAIIGASAGAPSAIQFALRHPKRCTALVLLVPATFVPRAPGLPVMQAPSMTEILFDTALRSDFLFWSAIQVARPTLMRAILATPPEVVRSATAEELARVNEALRHILPVSARRLGLLNDAAVTSSLERYALEQIAAPTLIMSAVDDLFGTYENALYTAGQIPGARFVGYPTGGHLLVGRNTAVLKKIAAFLRSFGCASLDPCQSRRFGSSYDPDVQGALARPGN